MRTFLRLGAGLALTIFVIAVSFESAVACRYAVGDINGDGRYDGLDITYAVRYFLDIPNPPYSCECPDGSGHIWYVAGDVNSSCSFNGLDVTYGVAYFKGGPLPHPCPDCPPEQ